jgi:hypothetical protein
VGFLHSPFGYLIGEPKDFPLQYTWPDYPIGHLIQVQARGLNQGLIAWPYWMMLGNPRLALRDAPPYQVISDMGTGDERILKLTGLPPGVVPIRISEGTPYNYVHIPGIGRAYRGDPFYDPELQMVDIGPHKYLLAAQGGGDLEVRLFRRTPLWWPATDVLQDALDHTTIIHHVQGSLLPSLLLAALVGIAVLWRVIRHPGMRVEHWGVALTAGLGLTLLRTLYALFRQGHLASMYVSYLRTIGLSWEVNPVILIATGIACTGSTWLFLSSRSRWARALAGLFIIAPTSIVALNWLGLNLTLNILARHYYGGVPLYGYAVGTMALIVAMMEATAVTLLIRIAGRRQRRAGDLVGDLGT